MPISLADRKFREQVPQRTSTDACPNYCHSETFRHVSRSGSFSPTVALDDGPVFRALMGQSRNPILGTTAHSEPNRQPDHQTRPWSNRGVNVDAYAVGSGSTFDALRIINEDGETIAVKLQWETQDFNSAASDWERSFSPLIDRNNRSWMTPIVDLGGYVVAYSGTTSPGHLWKRPDGSITLKPDVHGSSAADQALATNLSCSGWRSVSGGDYATFIVNANGEVVTHEIGDNGVVPPGFIASMMLGIAGGIVFGIVRSGIKTLIVQTATKRVIARNILKDLGQAGKFARGGSGRISLFHGTNHSARAGIEKAGLILRKGAGSAEDFGDGFYMTLDSRVAENASIVRTFSGAAATKPTTTVVMQVEMEAKYLGKIVDIRPGGMHREIWTKYLDQPLIGAPGKRVSWIFETAQNRGREFETFLAKHGLDDADTVIGSLGDKFTTGLAALPSGEISTQVVLRSQQVLNKVTEIIRGKSP